MPDVTLLIRKGCSNAPTVLRDLLIVLAHRGLGDEPTVVDIGELPAEDARTGYGSPTILIDGVDLYGMETPKPASPT